MKKLLAIVVLGLLLSGNVNAEILNCKAEKSYLCTEDGCTKIKNKVPTEYFINIDYDKKIYQRIIDKEIHTINIKFAKTKEYILAYGEPGGFIFKAGIRNPIKFVEIIHLSLATQNTFGKCKFK